MHIYPSVILAVALAVLPLAADDDIPLKYNRDIRPILANNCFACHGFDPTTREANLRLDTLEGAIAELESENGQAIVPGEPEQSILIKRLSSSDEDERMPPAHSGKTVTPEQQATLHRWIAQGAPYEQHWSFSPPRRQPSPRVENTKWPRNKIDPFILARLEKEGLKPSTEADRRTLIRRVAFDTTGMPPTGDELKQFLSDPSSDAYEKMVDRYLASEAYGEHMARQWMDLARYADTSGYQYDQERSMWVWRDWVIHAYNQNMPFDQFTIEQLAGDLLPNPQPQQVLATGFNRNHPITIEGGVIDEEYRTEYVIDRLNTTATVWMGLTVGCARCHDHKFDPLSQKEFYQLSAFFNQLPERGLNGFDPKQRIASPLAEPQDPKTVAKIASLQNQWNELRQAVDSTTLERWSENLRSKPTQWYVLQPETLKSSGGSQLLPQTDHSFIAGGANPQKDVYTVTASTQQTEITAIQLECLTDPSLPGGGPGRHSNSNFVLSEFELVAISKQDPSKQKTIKFDRAVADYSQANYGINNAIDGSVDGNNGWAVDGPTRKQPATAIFIATEPFGFSGGTQLAIRLRHEATYATHGIGRPRLSTSRQDPAQLTFETVPSNIRRIAKLPSTQRTKQETSELKTFIETEQAERATQLQSKINQLNQINQYPPTMIMQDMATPRTTYLLERGQYDRRGDPVTADVPSALLPLPSSAAENRLGFAQWLVDPSHPLTARVAVNRYWQQIFGTGIVKTAEDFGIQGEWPSHPALLDELAREFVESGWNVKAMLRLLLTSATYRQSAALPETLQQRDPENRLLARGPRYRLDAEEIRDQALAVSGLLIKKVGGPSVYPYQPEGLWLELNNRPGLSKKYQAGQGDALYRRGMYTFWKRTVLSPMLKTFDAPGREFCTVRRSRTNTPLQALLLLQGPQFVEAARHLAARMMLEGGTTAESRIAFGFERVTARLPKPKETAVMKQLYDARLQQYQQDKDAALQMLSVGQSARNTQLDAAEHAAWMAIARLLLNLDETINKG